MQSTIRALFLPDDSALLLVSKSYQEQVDAMSLPTTELGTLNRFGAPESHKATIKQDAQNFASEVESLLMQGSN